LAPGPSPGRDEERGRGFARGAGLDREHVFAAYERLLLFASLDLESMRRELEAEIIDQPEAVLTLIDDFSLFAVGTQHLTRPASYFLVGPTGVGKNFLVESLARVFERQWGVAVPLLTIEGPNYTYPSDINELRGATRGFIRSDEAGLLTEFHKKVKEAPVSIILVDEVEKAHPQLRRYFLSILDRGVTTDAHGNELSFAGTLIFFTSNIGYRERRSHQMPIGFAGEAEAEATYLSELSHSLKRTLSPEFINRVKIVRFRHLPRESARRILDLEFSRIAGRYRELHGIEVALTDAGREVLLDEGYSHEYGARHLAAVLQRSCNVEIGKMIRRDENRSARDPKQLLALLREARGGKRVVDLDALERQIVEEARAQVPYARIVVDAEDGHIVYRTEPR
ncbi:MAG: ATP-dependent Clp protease ATP-binding subunit, partial [Acidobacteria bacterium]|nr:ATP-dependent Clp protease ATP-binding subunit [Acidobacteriota bacterium]